MKTPHKRYHVIGRGLAGWHAKGINESSSGGDLHPRPWWAGGFTKGYLEQAIDGALVYDASGADERAFTRLIISGPMVDPALPLMGVSKFVADLRETAGRMAPALTGAFQTLAQTAADDPTYSGLDTVGVGVYRGLLATVPGIRLGTVRDGAIDWTDGTREPVAYPAGHPHVTR